MGPGGREQTRRGLPEQKLDRELPTVARKAAANEVPGPGLVSREEELAAKAQERAALREAALQEAEAAADGFVEIGAEDLEEVEEDGKPWLESDTFANEVSGGLTRTREFTVPGDANNMPTEADVLTDASADLYHQPGWDVGDVVDDPSDLKTTREQGVPKVSQPEERPPIVDRVPAVGREVVLDLRAALEAEYDAREENGFIRRPDGVGISIQETAIESVPALREAFHDGLDENGPIEVSL